MVPATVTIEVQYADTRVQRQRYKIQIFSGHARRSEAERYIIAGDNSSPVRGEHTVTDSEQTRKSNVSRVQEPGRHTKECG